MLSIGYASDDLVMFRIFYMLWCGDVEGSQWHSFQVAERSSLRKKGRQENAAMCTTALGTHVSTARDGCQVVMRSILYCVPVPSSSWALHENFDFESLRG